MMHRTIHVNIESIALNGIAQLDGPAFQHALSAELTRLVATSSVSPTAQTVQRVSIDVAPHADASQIGVQVARAIYAQFAREEA